LANKSKPMAVFFLWAGILVLISGCSINKTVSILFPERTAAQTEKKESVKPASPPIQPTLAAGQEPAPRMLAATNLVKQGKFYLDKKNPDQAIDVLERALSISPDNGAIYYYMAEAWLMKKNKHQALEFNRLAGMYFSNDPKWLKWVTDQQQRIQSLP